MHNDIGEHILKIQRLWRGYKVRKKLKETREEYMNIVRHIDNQMGEKTDVFFPFQSLCMPSFGKQSDNYFFRIRNPGTKYIDENVFLNSKGLLQGKSNSSESKKKINNDEVVAYHNKNIKLFRTQFSYNVQNCSSPLKKEKPAPAKNVEGKCKVLSESWLSNRSFNKECGFDGDLMVISDNSAALKKEELCLELLWINQAICSRKAYLQMKNDQTYK